MANVLNKTTGRYIRSVNTPNYPNADWWINPSGTEVLFGNNIPTKYWNIDSGTGTCTEMSSAQKRTVNDASVNLDDLKARRDSQINEKTSSLMTDKSKWTTPGWTTVDDVIQSGEDLKTRIGSASTKTAVDAVVDNR